MPTITFLPDNTVVEVKENTKILAAAIRNKIVISYGCGACQCGMCFINIIKADDITPMEDDEKKLLTTLDHKTDGSVRLACKTKILSGEVIVDLSANLSGE